jgi:hypothetical protein
MKELILQLAGFPQYPVKGKGYARNWFDVDRRKKCDVKKVEFLRLLKEHRPNHTACVAYDRRGHATTYVSVEASRVWENIEKSEQTAQQEIKKGKVGNE